MIANMGDWLSVVMEMPGEGRNRDVRKLARTNVLRTSVSERYRMDQMRTSSECPPANVTKRTKCERHRNVRPRTLQRGPNANVIGMSVSERYKGDQVQTSSERPLGNVTKRT